MNIAKKIWSSWNAGERVMWMAFIASIVTLFLDWYQTSLIPPYWIGRNGFNSFGVIGFIFWIYPMTCLVMKKKAHILAAIQSFLGCSVYGLYFYKLYTVERTSYIEPDVRVGPGLVGWMVCSLVLLVGCIIRYTVKEPVIADQSTK